ncbi:MAG TPA: DUF4157 domain-containing protein [Allosphingosinicella sp.]|nr:DUF4157 domain-containing protein [Allosphingosinicella sp.]
MPHDAGPIPGRAAKRAAAPPAVGRPRPRLLPPSQQAAMQQVLQLGAAGERPLLPSEQAAIHHVLQLRADPRSRALRPSEEAAMWDVLQRRAGETEPSGQTANRTGLPDRLKAGVEALSGLAMDDVRVHRNSSEPVTLGALAFTKGADIHLGPGQEEHLPHEAWHVVQQKERRVGATTQLKGDVPLNDDAGLEREAEQMGAKALRGAMPGSGNEAAPALRTAGAAAGGRALIQRVVGPRPEPEFRPNLAWSLWFQAMTEVEVGEEATKLGLARAPLDAMDELLTARNAEGIKIPPNYAGPKLEGPSSSPLAPKEEEGRKDQTETTSEQPSLSWAQFKKSYSIQKDASRFLQRAGKTIELMPDKPLGTQSAIAYVANILTIPRNSVPAIIALYARGGISPANYGSFAMVIGVNSYRSLDGKSVARVNDAASAATDAPFPCAVVPFVWDFDWGRPFNDVKADFRKMSQSDQGQALLEEKARLVQSIIPYGQLRERVAADETTRAYVKALSAKHKAVYIHLGDDDAVQPPEFPLLDRYSAKILDQNLPALVVGGYRFSTAESGGDLSKDDPGDVLTEIASQLDNLFRSMLPEINRDLVYPTEPNLVFLASKGNFNYLEDMLTPSNQEGRLLEKERLRDTEAEKGSFDGEPYYSTGLLYGRGTNEGENLRGRLTKAMGSPKQGITTYDPNLSVATASTRFTLRDVDKVRHEPKERAYGGRRREALEKGGKQGFLEQIVDDMLTIKQSHIGGLKKEIMKLEGKESGAIATDVLNAFKAVMLDRSAPKPLSKKSARYLELINKNQRSILELAEKASVAAEQMLAAIAKEGERKDEGKK